MEDSILTSLVKLAMQGTPESEQGVSLFVGGFLVSGFVISHEKYAQHHMITRVVYDEANKRLKETDAAIQSVPHEFSKYIHLRDAKFYVPVGKPIFQNIGLFVRFPIEAVNGFFFGILNCIE